MNYAMGHDHAVCDKCGHRTPNIARVGMTCNAPSPAGYCDGTMRTSAELAEMQKVVEPSPADAKPVKARRKK